MQIYLCSSLLTGRFACPILGGGTGISSQPHGDGEPLFIACHLPARSPYFDYPD